MKINKRMLKQIIKEELDAIQEIGTARPFDDRDNPAGMDPSAGAQEQEQQDPIQGRVQDALKKWKAGESVVKTIDDPNEVIPFVVGILNHLRTLNPDLSASELARTIDVLRTKVLPDMKRGLK